MTVSTAPAPTRDDAVRQIRAALRRRSGKAWSVKGGRGTAWGWITVCSPPSRAADRWGTMTPAECRELADLLGLPSVHPQGATIPGQSDYYREFLDRAEGRTPSVVGHPQWD